MIEFYAHESFIDLFLIFTVGYFISEEKSTLGKHSLSKIKLYLNNYAFGYKKNVINQMFHVKHLMIHLHI